MPERHYQFIFVIGVEGSGTTMLTGILGKPARVVGLGGSWEATTIPRHDKEALLLRAKFNRATLKLWDRAASWAEHLEAKQSLARTIDRLLRMEKYAHATHVLYKRSAPFKKSPGYYLRDRYRPDLSDLPEVFGDLRIIAIYREPRASTHSCFRRRFREELRQCAVISEEQLTYLSAQLASLDRSLYRIINYEKFCAAPQNVVRELSNFCGLPADELASGVEQREVAEGMNERWRRELAPADRDFLDGFFDDRRLAQWQFLAQHAA